MNLGENNELGLATEVPVHYYAQDTLRHTKHSETFYVDLTNNMESSDGSPTSLLSVKAFSSDESCGVLSYDRTGFFIRANQVNICDYRYRVGAAMVRMSTAVSGDGYSEATARVAVAESAEQLLPVSSTTSSATPVSVDVKAALGNLGYELDTSRYTLSETVTLPNGETTNSTAVSDPANNIIEYTPGFGLETGIERILYSYSDGTTILSGSLDIAVSTTLNGAPVANSSTIETLTAPETSETITQVPYNTTIAIDTLSFIADPDGDILQLIDVYAYDATVNVVEDANLDGNLFNDTVFSFSTTKPGKHYITYVVTDKKGGYATGVLEVTSEALYPTFKFENEHLIISPPLTLEQAESLYAGFETIGVGDGTNAVDGVSTIAHSRSVAEGICSARGDFLPSQEQLQSLYAWKPGGQLFTEFRYPVDNAYWTSTQVDESNTKIVNLLDGVVSDSTNENNNYVLCVSEYYTPSIVPVSLNIAGDTKMERQLDIDVSEVYQITIKDSGGTTEQVPASAVSWTVTDTAFSGFDEETGILTAYRGGDKVPSLDVDIEACFQSLCDSVKLSMYTPLDIISYGGYEFLPLLSRDQVLRFTDNNPSIYAPNDTTDGSWEYLLYILRMPYWENFIESGHTATQTSDYCSAINWDGGGWSEFSSATIAQNYAAAWNADPVYTAMLSPRTMTELPFEPYTETHETFMLRGEGKMYLFKMNNDNDYSVANNGISYVFGPAIREQATTDYYGDYVHVYLSCVR